MQPPVLVRLFLPPPFFCVPHELLAAVVGVFAFFPSSCFVEFFLD
jgi:hypothetical protein